MSIPYDGFRYLSATSLPQAHHSSQHLPLHIGQDWAIPKTLCKSTCPAIQRRQDGCCQSPSPSLPPEMQTMLCSLTQISSDPSAMLCYTDKARCDMRRLVR
jgi:hypothetical protein